MDGDTGPFQHDRAIICRNPGTLLCEQGCGRARAG